MWVGNAARGPCTSLGLRAALLTLDGLRRDVQPGGDAAGGGRAGGGCPQGVGGGARHLHAGHAAGGPGHDALGLHCVEMVPTETPYVRNNNWAAEKWG